MATATARNSPQAIAIRARALAVKRHNAVTAALCGAVLSAAAIRLFRWGMFPGAPLACVLGLGAGLLYANAFEYLLHRFFLHWGEGFLVQSHMLHHNSLGTADEPRYVNFATSPWVVVLVFVANSAAVLAALFLLARWPGADFPAGALGAGVFAGFTLYFVVYEEVHWRIHMGGWLPQWLGFARRHHMLHHRDADGHYNVFLPVFDWLFGIFEPARNRRR